MVLLPDTQPVLPSMAASKLAASTLAERTGITPQQSAMQVDATAAAAAAAERNLRSHGTTCASLRARACLF